MDLNHLHLHVRDLHEAEQFYGRWFHFSEFSRHGDLLFLRNEDGFDLALLPEGDPAPFPPWFHFGFRLSSPDDVRHLYGRMKVEEVPMPKPLYDEDDLVSFQCVDPDGHRIEIYWE